MSELLNDPTFCGLLMIAAAAFIGWGLGLFEDIDRRD